MFSAEPPNAEKGRASSNHRFTPEAICAAIRQLHAVDNPDRRVGMVVQIVRNHGLDNPDVVALARAEIEGARCSPHIRREALAQLQPRMMPFLQTMPQSALQNTEGADGTATAFLTAEGDPELTRIANGLAKAAAFRLWLALHEINRVGGGVGQVGKQALWEQLPRFGIQMTRRYFNALIRRENGRFWAISKDGKALHLRSYEKVSQRLTALALQVNPDLVMTNAPGQKFKAISLAGSVADFEAHTLSAWLDSRRDQGMTNIALSTLSALFGRSANTIRDWLSRAEVQAQRNYTQYAGTDEQLIPDHASLYVTKEGSYAITWRISNTYTPEPTKERQHRFIPKHVHHTCQHLVEEWSAVHPAGDCGTALQSTNGVMQGGGVYRTRRLYFDSSKGTLEARKTAYKHLHWHQDTDRPHHVFLGFKRSPSSKKRVGEIGLYECVDPDGNGATRLHERDYQAQHRPHHRQQIECYRDYLREG